MMMIQLNDKQINLPLSFCKEFISEQFKRTYIYD